VTWNRSDKPATPYSQSAKLEYTRGDKAPNKYTMMEPRYTSQSSNRTDANTQEAGRRFREYTLDLARRTRQDPSGINEFSVNLYDDGPPKAYQRSGNPNATDAVGYVDHLNYTARGPEERKDNFALLKEMEGIGKSYNAEVSSRVGNVIRKMVGLRQKGLLSVGSERSREANRYYESTSQYDSLPQYGPNMSFPVDHFKKTYHDKRPKDE